MTAIGQKRTFVVAIPFGNGAIQNCLRIGRMNAESNLGILYILTNPAMPGMVKVGFSRHMDSDKRADELSRSTAIPLPFEALFSVPVEHPSVVEKKVHRHLAKYRIAQEREFFRLSVADALHCVAEILWSSYRLSGASEFDIAYFMRGYLLHVEQMGRDYPEQVINTGILPVLLDALAGHGVRSIEH